MKRGCSGWDNRSQRNASPSLELYRDRLTGKNSFIKGGGGGGVEVMMFTLALMGLLLTI